MDLFVTTARLLITPLTMDDDAFMFELLNSDGWIKFIGNRNINAQNEAADYIQKILENKNIAFWVVRLHDKNSKIGIVSFIKRGYLEYHDIGFAFLPQFYKKGYAYEATNAVMKRLIKDNKLSVVLATTLPENIDSIGLLQKMNFVFEKEIQVGNEVLHLYKTVVE